MTAALSLLSLLMTMGKAWLDRQDRSKLIASGRLEAVFEASQGLNESLRRIRDVDATLADDDRDPEWVRRVREKAGASKLD